MRCCTEQLETTMATNATTKRADVSVTFHRAGVEVRIDEQPEFMILTYADGATHEVTMTDLQPVGNACAWHGAKQKLIDAAAISRDPATGRAASVAIKRAAVNEVLERMRAGQWFKPRADGTTGAGGLLYRALVRFYDGRKTPEQVRAFLDSLDDAKQQALRRNSQIAAIIEELRPKAREDAEFDPDTALEEFGNDAE